MIKNITPAQSCCISLIPHIITGSITVMKIPIKGMRSSLTLSPQSSWRWYEDVFWRQTANTKHGGDSSTASS